MPLLASVHACYEMGIEPDLLGFLRDSKRAGWRFEKAIAVIADAVEIGLPFAQARDLVTRRLWLKAVEQMFGWVRFHVWSPRTVTFEAH